MTRRIASPKRHRATATTVLATTIVAFVVSCDAFSTVVTKTGTTVPPPLRRTLFRLTAAREKGEPSLTTTTEPTTTTGITDASTPPVFSPRFATVVDDEEKKKLRKLEAKLAKNVRETSVAYDMFRDGDRVMVCVSGGKDSATMLHLLLNLRAKLKPIGVDFSVTAVHLNQVQPGYDGSTLIEWLESLDVPYKIVEEDTYTIVKDKTPEDKTYCSMCSRLRRGILYRIASELNANKIALGHHGDDAVETLFLNLVHTGQMKSMPARFYSDAGKVHVMRPLISCFEDDIRTFAEAKGFPILPCNLCGTQPDAQRAKVKMLVGTLEALNPNARKNIVNAIGDVRPSHLLDVGLRKACGLDGMTGEIVDADRAGLVRGYERAMQSGDTGLDGDAIGPREEMELEGASMRIRSSFIENFL